MSASLSHRDTTKAAPNSAAEADPNAQTQAARREHYIRLLNEALDIGMRRLRLLAPDAAEPAASPTANTDAAYAQITRSLRQTILLADKLADPAPKPDPAFDRTTARRRIIRDVGDAIHESRNVERAESLEYELLERLDDPDMEHELATRPVEAIVTEICRDLGLRTSFWKRRTPPDIEQLKQHAAAPPASLGSAAARETPAKPNTEPERSHPTSSPSPAGGRGSG